jgi:hypothetical protein
MRAPGMAQCLSGSLNRLPVMAHRVISLLRSNLVASGVKRTSIHRAGFMSTRPDKTNNKHHYDVILSLRSGRRALCPSKRTTRERNGHTQNCSLLLNVTKSTSRDASGRLNASRPGQAARI